MTRVRVILPPVVWPGAVGGFAGRARSVRSIAGGFQAARAVEQQVCEVS